MSTKLRHTRSKYREAIQQGIDLLNEQVNDNWQNKIDLGMLNLANGHACVLGQLFEHYYAGLTHLGIGDGEKYGFEITYDNDISDRINWNNLTNAWKREIEILRSQHIG